GEVERHSQSIPFCPSGFRRRTRFNGTTLPPPSVEPAFDMGHRLQSHALRGLRRQRRAQATGTKEYEPLIAAEYGLKILALGVDPKLQHAARAVKCARNAALPIQLADIT